MTVPVSYTSKSFILPMGIAIIIIVQVSMGLMFIPILLGLHFFISMAFFFGAIFFGIALLAGEAIYTLNDDGIFVQIRPSIPWKLWKYEKKKFYNWDSILSYSIGEDMTRGFEKFHYIKVEIKGLNNDLKISDNAKYFAGFEEFKQAFIEMVNTRNEQITEVKFSKETDQSSKQDANLYSGKKLIKRKKSFYESALAKVITLLFLLLIVGICGFLIFNPQFFRLTHLFRISIVLIPGIGYMFYKSFLEKRK